MIAQATILDDLSAIVGGKHAYPADESQRFAVDGMTPRAVVEPGSYEEVAAVIRYASEEGLAVIPLGGGTKRNIGNLPARYDLALSLSRLKQIIEHEPADLTVTCQAGISVPEVQRRLDFHGQEVPLESLLPEQPSVGGVLAANANGPSRAAYGALRDFTIGMRVVTADGRITRAGGKVVKNVAGYDLCKLYIGSLGTLGVIVEATFKVMPTARCKRHVLLHMQTSGDASRLACALYKRGLSLSYAQLRGTVGETESKDYRSTAWLLEMGLAGSEPAVDRSEKEVSRLIDEFGGAVVVGDSPEGPRKLDISSWTEGEGLICRFVVVPSKMAVIIGQLAQVRFPDIEAEPATGVVRAYWPETDEALDILQGALAIAARHSATAVVERCSPELKQHLDVFGDPPPALELMRRVKQQFDPKGILSPGRFVGRV